MELKKKIGIHLDQIKQLIGVENVVLVQRDGNPIQTSGVWFSKDEVFNVSSITSAIYNIGIHLHPEDLKYILIEGRKGKILIAPMKSPYNHSLNKILEQQGRYDIKHEFFIVITAQPNINLGGIFLQTSECLKKIKTTLITSGESFKPPLIQYDNEKIQEIIRFFREKDNIIQEFNGSTFSLSLSDRISTELKKVLNNFSIAIPDLIYASIILKGGFLVSSLHKSLNLKFTRTVNFEQLSLMNDAIFQVADRCAWILKKMKVEDILLDCENRFHIIYGMESAIFNTEIFKSKQKLALILLILPQFQRKINNLIREAIESKKTKTDMN